MKTKKLGTVMLAMSLVTLSACSGDAETPDDDGSASVSDAATGDASEQGAEAIETLLDEDSRTDQQAVGLGAERAASFGFDHQALATRDEIDQTRQDTHSRKSDTSGTDVTPSQCTTAINTLDWSPIQTPGDEHTRVDFGSESFSGTGTIEVANLGEGAVSESQDQLDSYVDTVEQLTTECDDLEMTISDATVPEEYGDSITYSFSARSLDLESGTGLYWQRTPESTNVEGVSSESISATVNVRQRGDYVGMVSFVGPESVGDEEFEEMSSEILDSALQNVSAS